MDRYSEGVYAPFMSEADLSRDIEFEMSSPGAYSETQHARLDSFGEPISVDRNSFAFPLHYSEQPPPVSFAYQAQHSHQRHLSTSTQSTQSSAYRSSNGSVFSQWHPRSSVASSNSTWSHFSDNPREPNLVQAGSALDAQLSYTPSPISTPIEIPLASPPSQRVSQRQPPEKEPFQTCVSRPKRSRRSQKEPRYWCTACKEGFGEKYDWKRHEETFQERKESYECGLCKNVYFLDKDFQKHHRESHRCQICVGRQHVDAAKSNRQARTGWGCGFCSHFSSDWTERCNHVGQHFEKGATMSMWNHSQVIFSLLQRRELIVGWCALLEATQTTRSPFSWKPQTTGRVDGYPEANMQPQLQDLLEYYTPDQDAAALLRLAFDKGRREKALPPAPSRPTVPEKDHGSHHTRRQPSTTHPQPTLQFAPPPPPVMQHPMNDVPSWDSFLGTIPEDMNLPTNVCDQDAVTAAFDQLPYELRHF